MGYSICGAATVCIVLRSHNVNTFLVRVYTLYDTLQSAAFRQRYVY